MTTLNQRISLLSFLGDLFRDISLPNPKSRVTEAEQLKDALPVIQESNPWFTPESVYRAISIWGQTLSPGAISEWISKYNLSGIPRASRSVMVIMAGNIPMVGMHDFICTLLAGHRFIGKLSSKDKLLFPLIKKWITNFDDDWHAYIDFTEKAANDVEVVIATGSNNTSRIIREAYSGTASIIRHNRNSVALLTGKESDADLRGLADDILLFFGLGCRSVSRLFTPPGYDLSKLAGIINDYQFSLPVSMLNNLRYQKALAALHEYRFIDAGKICFIRNEGLNSPVGTVYYSDYNDVKDIEIFRSVNRNNIQCCIGDPEIWDSVTGFGNAQSPALDDYADGIDTMKFLIDL